MKRKEYQEENNRRQDKGAGNDSNEIKKRGKSNRNKVKRRSEVKMMQGRKRKDKVIAKDSKGNKTNNRREVRKKGEKEVQKQKQ